MQETIPGKVASPYSGGDAAKKRGGGNATPGTLSRKNYVHRFRKRTLAKSQHLLFVERHRRSQPHPRPHGPETPDSTLQTPDVSGERDPTHGYSVYGERPRTAYLCNGRSAPGGDEAPATGRGGAVAAQPRRRHPGHLRTRVTASRTQHLQHTTSIKKRC